MPDLETLVASSDKQRFELSSDGRQVRARQGHSVSVEGDWPIATPPAVLYHGTIERFLQPIIERGLLPLRRHHVHLSSAMETAQLVGGRRGRPVVLVVAAAQMAQDGFSFRLSSNGVWLSARVPPAYLEVLPEAQTSSARKD
jgi:putative RNA 2'-phosphotransferase